MEAIDLFNQGEFTGFADIPDVIYNNDRKYFRNSWQSDLAITPAHLKYRMDHPKESRAFDFGRALHYRMESQELFKKNVLIKPAADGRTTEGKAIKAKYDAELKRLNLRILIDSDDEAAIEEMAEKVFSIPEVASLIKGAKAEHTMAWIDPETKVKCKAKMDLDLLAEHQAIIDFKTCNSASFLEFQKSVGNFYYLQAAMYTHGASVLLGHPVKDFIFLAMEKNPPYEFALYRMDEASLEKGMEDYQANLRRFKQCNDRNEWPGYPKRVIDINLPPWKWKQTNNFVEQS